MQIVAVPWRVTERASVATMFRSLHGDKSDAAPLGWSTSKFEVDCTNT